MLFDKIAPYNFEQVIYGYDEDAGLKAIIALHDTTLGPALGGTRMWTYSNEEEALEDVLHLALGMTYKSAAAGLDLGGGKGLIIGDPYQDKSEALFRAYGRLVESLKGRYITAKDMGTNEWDLDMMSKESDWVLGGTSSKVNVKPSPFTATGVWRGIKAASKVALGSGNLQGITVAVQGLGEVATSLVELLLQDGAQVIAADINQHQVEAARRKWDIEIVDPEKIFEVEADIFAPCAVGGVVNEKTLPLLKCKVIAGGANNILVSDEIGEELLKRGILYAPDYVVNAGGLISVEYTRRGLGENAIHKKIEEIEERLEWILTQAKEVNLSTHVIADRYAEERIRQVSNMSRFYLP